MWKIINGKLEKEFVCKDFDQAVGFICLIRDEANKLNHHPDIMIFDYKKVKIWLVTHDAWNKITDQDHQLSHTIDEIYNTFISK